MCKSHIKTPLKCVELMPKGVVILLVGQYTGGARHLHVGGVGIPHQLVPVPGR